MHSLVNATNCRTLHTTCGHKANQTRDPHSDTPCPGASNATANSRGVRQFVACTGEAKWCSLLVDYYALSKRLRALADAASQVGIE